MRLFPIIGTALVALGACGVEPAPITAEQLDSLEEEIRQLYRPSAEGYALDLFFDSEVIGRGDALRRLTLVQETCLDSWPPMDQRTRLVFELTPSPVGLRVDRQDAVDDSRDFNDGPAWRVVNQTTTTVVDGRLDQPLRDALLLATAQLEEYCFDEATCQGGGWGVGGVGTWCGPPSVTTLTVDTDLGLYHSRDLDRGFSSSHAQLRDIPHRFAVQRLIMALSGTTL